MSKDKVGALAILALSIAYGLMARNLPEMPGVEAAGVTPSSLPVVLSITGGIIAVLMLILPPKNIKKKTGIIDALKGLDFRRVGSLFLLMLAYGWTLKTLGFLVSTILFLFGGFRVMGERRIWRILLVSVSVTIVFWLILTRLLSIYLEPGVLFGGLE